MTSDSTECLSPLASSFSTPPVVVSTPSTLIIELLYNFWIFTSDLSFAIQLLVTLQEHPPHHHWCRNQQRGVPEGPRLPWYDSFFDMIMILPWIHNHIMFPNYPGIRERRLRGQKFDELIEEINAALTARWPGILIQFEDFGNLNAFRLLKDHRNRVSPPPPQFTTYMETIPFYHHRLLILRIDRPSTPPSMTTSKEPLPFASEVGTLVIHTTLQLWNLVTKFRLIADPPPPRCLWFLQASQQEVQRQQVPFPRRWRGRNRHCRPYCFCSYQGG